MCNYSKPVAYFYISEPSHIESSTDYTYAIYKEMFYGYHYTLTETEMYISKVKSRKVIKTGNIRKKEDLKIFQDDIDKYVVKDKYGMLKGSGIEIKNWTIKYKGIELNLVDKLADKLF